MMVRSCGRSLAARHTQSAILARSDGEKTSWRDLAEKGLAGRAAGLIPPGAGGLNSLAPAVLKAVNRYMKMPPAELLELGFRAVRAVGRGLHLRHQITITIALPHVLGELPRDIADLGEVRRA